MRRTITLFLSFIMAITVMADNVTPEEALQQAQSFLQNRESTSGINHAPRTTTAPRLTMVKQVKGLYVFNVENNGGFIIVSNDDRTVPILGYSDSGTFDPDNIPANMQAWLQGYADEIAWLQQHGSSATNDNTLKQPRHAPTTKSDIAPLVTTKWNQGAPYNNLCPKYSGNNRAVTGCVATAMAQVMNYHKWPQSETTTIPGYTTKSYNLDLTSGLPATTFDWDNMQDTYTSSATGAAATAVATLMQYCGYSVEMDYGPSSGSNTDMVAAALKEYFDYNTNTTKFVIRSSYTTAKWTELIYHELANSRPVVYGGMSSGGGHEFVCDGYKYENETDYFHINWGWGGSSDDYFVLSSLNPYEQGIGGSTSNDGFHYGQDAVIGIQPSTSTGNIADITPNDIDLTMTSMTLSSNTIFLGQTATVTLNIKNNSDDDYDGDIWLGIKYSDGYSLVEGNTFSIPAGQTVGCDIPFTPTQIGTYDLVFFFPNTEGSYSTYGNVGATLTVETSTTNQYVPVYGYYCDQFSRSQFIIPAENMEDMLNNNLNGMTFYSTNKSVSWGSAEFDVYLKEVSGTTISELNDWDTLNKVYSGSLSISNGMMVITFTDSYQYQGGNLLVGINQTKKGSHNSCNWIGTTANGASLGGYNSSINQQNFLPITTFAYTPGEALGITKPTDVTINYTGGTTAEVSWTSTESAWDIDVNGTVTENVTNPYTLTDLEFATEYIIKVRAKSGNEVSDWSIPATFTTDLSDETCSITLALTDSYGDGWNGAAIQVVDALTGIVIGTVSNTNEAEKGEAQNYPMTVPNGRDINFVWVKGSYDSECSYKIYDVNGDVIFTGSGAMNDTFTYHVDCVTKPSDLIASDIGPLSAVLSWTGSQDSYNVRYRMAAIWEDDFENGLDNWTLYTENEGSGWYVVNPANGLSFDAHSGSMVASSWSWNNSAYNADNWLVTPLLNLQGSLVFWVRTNAGYPDNYEVKLSTTGNTVSDFTATSAVTLQTMAPAPATGNWEKVIIDLSAYNGQQGYIAIHHEDNDNNYLLIDDFGIYKDLTAREWTTITTDEPPLTISGLTPGTEYEWQVQGNLTDGTTKWSNMATFTTLSNVVLSSTADNSDIIDEYNGQEIGVTLSGHTFYKDSYWNTLCLPFTMTADQVTAQLAPKALKTLSSASFADGTLTLNFEDATTIKAGKPYIIKWDADDKITSPTFTDVTISNTVSDINAGVVTFKGLYAPLTYAAGVADNSVLFMKGENTLYYPDGLDATNIDAFHAYFALNGITAGELIEHAGRIVLNFDDETTEITTVQSSEFKVQSDSWYTIDGRRLNNKPTQKGVYIVNGKKVVIK